MHGAVGGGAMRMCVWVVAVVVGCGGGGGGGRLFLI